MAWHGIGCAFGAVAMLVLSACAPGTYQIGSRTFDFGDPDPVPSPMTPAPTMPSQQPMLTPPGAAQTFGLGPVQVSLLLPLSGDPGTASVGLSLANASRLAIGFIEANPNIAENITITLRDTGTSVQGATFAASAAVSSGAKLIIGPLRADQVTAAGAVARSGGVPLIGFSNNPVAAGPGVYLLSVLPDMEMKRSIRFIQTQGRRGIAGIFPATPFGEAQAAAFRQQAASAGFASPSVYTFSSAAEAAQIVAQAMPQISSGNVDTLFIPDRASAPSFGMALSQAGVTRDRVRVVGSADWEGDPAILSSPALTGAIYPAVDPSGIGAISNDYQRQFGMQPHALATIAYTATILANVNTLSMAMPPYNSGLLTSASGFNGRDGVFRFLPNGRAEYALVIKQLSAGGSAVIDGAKL
jgi:branched-chain amino acid transport system substrate-binding protein